MKTTLVVDETLDARRTARRAAMPVVAALVTEYREMFPSAVVVYAKENGITVGKPPARENAFTIPRGYRKPAGGWPK